MMKGVFFMSVKTRKLVFAAMLTSIAVVLSILSRAISAAALPLPFLRFSLAPAVIIFIGALLGPGYGAVAGVITDLLTFMYSGGAFFPMFTLTMALYGILGAAFFYNKPVKIARTVIFTVIIQTLLSAVLNTLWNIYLYGAMDAVKLSARLSTTYVACVCYIIILSVLFKYKEKFEVKLNVRRKAAL